MTKEEIIEKVKKNMKTIGWLNYDKEIGIKCFDKEEIEDREYKKKKYILSSFVFPMSKCLPKMENLMAQ